MLTRPLFVCLFVDPVFHGSFTLPCRAHSRPRRPRSFWLAPRIAASGRVQQRKSAIHGLLVTMRMLRVKSDKSNWLWSQIHSKTGMLLDLARGRDSWCWPKGARPLGTRMVIYLASRLYLHMCAQPRPQGLSSYRLRVPGNEVNVRQLGCTPSTGQRQDR